jgi:metal-responsive CopG/Arc/MetJ family transcriptional regulator
MASQNNVHIPDKLLSAMNAAAQAEGKTADELLAEAARRYLAHKELDDLVARGRTHAERVGRTHAEAVTAVRDIRRGR